MTHWIKKNLWVLSENGKVFFTEEYKQINV